MGGKLLKVRGVATLVAVFVLLVALFPVHAGAEQDPIGEVAGAVGDAVGAVEQAPSEEAPSDATGAVEQAAGDATGAVEQVAGDATGAVEQVAGDATGAVEQAAGDATGAVEQAAGDATGAVEQAADTGGTIERTSGNGAFTRDRRTQHVVGALAYSSSIRRAAVRSTRIDGALQSARLDTDEARPLPPGLLTEVVQAGNEIVAGTPSSDEAVSRNPRGWLPGWLPSLLAITGFSALVLIGVALSLIKGGVVALASSRRHVRPPMEQAATSGVGR